MSFPVPHLGALAVALLMFAAAAMPAWGHPYRWENFAGKDGGSGDWDAVGSAARFWCPTAVAVDASGNLYVADWENHTIRKITSAGVVTTLAGRAGNPGSTDGTGPAARFNYPAGVAVDGTGNVYVADSENFTIRKITSAGLVTTLAGKAGESDRMDGPRLVARFSWPRGVAVDGNGNVYVSDSVSIRKITDAGIVSTLAGSVLGSADGIGSAARFGLLSGTAVDGDGNVYVADSGNDTIRKITSAGVVTTLAGNAGLHGSADGKGSAARFYSPQGVAVDGSENVYVADSLYGTIRKITSSGMVTTLAGKPGNIESPNFNPVSIDGKGSAARFYSPHGVAVDGSGNLYIAEETSIRKVTSAGVVTTIGGGQRRFGDDHQGGFGTRSFFNYPYSIAATTGGTLYVSIPNLHSVVIGTLPSANTAPVATDDAVGLRGTAKTAIAVSDNDTDAEGDPLTVAAVTQGAFGRVELKNGAVSYTAGRNFPGQDSFQYTIDDKEGGLATGTVTVVNPFVVPVGNYATPLLDETTLLPAGAVKTKLAADGSVTGSVIVGGKSYPLKGRANFAGEFTQTIYRGELPALTVAIYFSAAGFGQAVIGVTDGTTSLSGDAAEDANSAPPGITQGNFTLSLPFAGNGTTTPASIGYATVSVGANGAAKFVGKFPDGSAFSVATQLHADGRPYFSCRSTASRRHRP